MKICRALKIAASIVVASSYFRVLKVRSLADRYEEKTSLDWIHFALFYLLHKRLAVYSSRRSPRVSEKNIVINLISKRLRQRCRVELGEKFGQR